MGSKAVTYWTAALLAFGLWAYHSASQSQVVFESQTVDVQTQCADPAKHGILGCLKSSVGGTWVMEEYEKTRIVRRGTEEVVGVQGLVTVRILPLFGSTDRWLYQFGCHGQGQYSHRARKISGSILGTLHQIGPSNWLINAAGLDMEEAVPGSIPYEMAAWLCSDKAPFTETAVERTLEDARKAEAERLNNDARIRAEARGEAPAGVSRIR